MKTDSDLIQIVDRALEDAIRRSGTHLLCRPGCAQCCVGVFAINALDAERLRRGAVQLSGDDPERFARLARRVEVSIAGTASAFPGDPATGLLEDTPEGEARFEEFANDEVCPVLDPATATCDLYAFRPMTCRIFGPPVRAGSSAFLEQDEESGLGVCELCFVDAKPEEIAAAELIADPEGLEDELLGRITRAAAGSVMTAGSPMPRTTVAYALSTG